MSLILLLQRKVEKMNYTIDFYERNARDFCEKHDCVKLNSFHIAIKNEIKSGSKILEIGCGSGRDASRALAEGYDVFALDGSRNLLVEVERIHPELVGRLLHAVLPVELDYKTGYFDAFYSVACMMHFSESELKDILMELKRVLKKGGKGLVSVPSCRADVTNEGVDIHNRTFHIRETESWIEIFNRSGFEAKAGPPESDKLNREGVWWVTYTLLSI